MGDENTLNTLNTLDGSHQTRRSSSSVSCWAAMALQPEVFWPDHNGEKSPLPRLSAFCRKGSMAAPEHGKRATDRAPIFKKRYRTRRGRAVDDQHAHDGLVSGKRVEGGEIRPGAACEYRCGIAIAER